MRPLTVLITNCTLATRSGTELYVRDLALGLAERGHTPVVYTPHPGALSDELSEAGVAVHTDVSGVPTAPDIVHGHHARPTIEALRRFRRAPGIFMCHDRLSETDEPPLFPRIRRHVAVDLNCRERLVEAGVPEERIDVILNAVDVRRFAPRPPLPPAPRRALVFSNYASDATHLPAVRQACAELGLPLDVVGAGAGQGSAAPELLVPAYDLVFAKARCALEAMAVGTAVVLCDFQGLGAMVTRADVDRLRRWNFGMRTLTQALDPRLIRREVERYDPLDAAAVSGYVRESATLDGCVDELVSLYRRVIEEHHTAPTVARWQETWAGARAMRRALPRRTARDGLRRLPVVGRALMTLARLHRRRRRRRDVGD